MKTFIAALCAFLLLLAIIIWNGSFVRTTIATLEEMLSSLPDCESAASAVKELHAYWEERHSYLSFSIAFEDIHNMDVCILQILAAAQNKDALQFETARLLALDAIEDMQRLERITMDCIF